MLTVIEQCVFRGRAHYSILSLRVYRVCASAEEDGQPFFLTTPVRFLNREILYRLHCTYTRPIK